MHIGTSPHKSVLKSECHMHLISPINKQSQLLFQIWYEFVRRGFDGANMHPNSRFPNPLAQSSIPHLKRESYNMDIIREQRKTCKCISIRFVLFLIFQNIRNDFRLHISTGENGKTRCQFSNEIFIWMRTCRIVVGSCKLFPNVLKIRVEWCTREWPFNKIREVLLHCQ